MDPELLAQILAAQQPTLSPLALAATRGGVSRTTLGQLSDPNILLGTGVADPMAIAGGASQYVSGRRAEEFDKSTREYVKSMPK